MEGGAAGGGPTSVDRETRKLSLEIQLNKIYVSNVTCQVETPFVVHL